jgi:hypothetical protein
LESKLKVLGQLLVDGLLHEDHEVREARLLLTAIEEVEQPHLRVMHHLTTSYLEGLSEEEREAAKEKYGIDAWPFERLAQELGVSHSALELTVATLSGNNLVHGQADVFGMPTVPQMQWSLTEPGRAVLERFRRAGEEAAGSPMPEDDESARQDKGGDVE